MNVTVAIILISCSLLPLGAAMSLFRKTPRR